MRLFHVRRGTLTADVPDPRPGNGNGDGPAPAAPINGAVAGLARQTRNLARRAARLPTLAAARALLTPHAMVFLVALWLSHLAAAGYYTFYPIYLTREIGLGEQWLGLIANLGVAVEVFFVLGFGWLVRRFGLPAVMAAAAGATAVRLLLLYAMPNVWIAVGTQLLHGFTVLLIHIGPPVYLNQRAEAGYRSSIQGLYAMAIYGTGRIVGNMLAGRVAEWNVPLVFGAGAVCCLLAAGMFAWAFSDREQSVREAV